ncbi:MAG TPA: ATP-binding protein [Bacteroidales bacterium]|nr:response regulator [Bacteroidales bacterium]HNR41746.1 ATP-binding protein [Bacteroidales bacterium]HPM18102.1 ATP-binding protein [Bacteroidales bacterium]HQG77239.1 ATP-binding protein [Bacteroidales bacterium]
MNWYKLNNTSFRFIFFSASLFFSLLFPYRLSAAPADQVPIVSGRALEVALVPLPAYIISLILLLAAACILIIIFSTRLRNTNRELTARNKQVEDINQKLQKANNELLSQKDALEREYSNSEMFYRMLIRSADDGISFYDRNWKLKFTNPAFYSVIGYTQQEYESLKMSELVHPDDSDYEKRRIAGLSSRDFFESELRLRHKDGHYVNLSTRSVAVKNDEGETIGSLTVSRDITSLKKVHEELMRANAEAEASNRLKSSFLANISHEVRTPLNSVVGFANLLLSSDLSNEVKEEYIEHINHNSEKLLQIIGDIIDLSRLESAQIEITYEEASINSIVNEVVDEARKIVKRNEKSIIIIVKNLLEIENDLVFTDRVWLKRVLNHLLDNAVKFTLEGSIQITCSKESDNLVFRIRDTGIGINKENLDHIFEEFRQEINGHHRPFEGLGVGLTLAKEVIERMGGKIFVQSEKGVGSEFSFSLPYRPAGGSSRMKSKIMSQDNLGSQNNWSGKKCLIVDDNKDILLYLERVLSETGITIFSARSGFEAIDILKRTTDIDLILLDMQMPEMNGIEATRELRKIRGDIPIIAQTAFIFEDDKDIILEAGCDACLIKPIRKEHLLTVMSGFIKSA